MKFFEGVEFFQREYAGAYLLKLLAPAVAIALLIFIFYSNDTPVVQVVENNIDVIFTIDEDEDPIDSNTWWNERSIVIGIVDEEQQTIERIISSIKSENVIREIIPINNK